MESGAAMGVLNRLGGFFAVVFGLAILGTILQSVFVLSALLQVGAEISLADAAGMIAADLTGLAPVYGVFITIALMIAFFIGTVVIRVTPLPRALVYAGAAAGAMAVMLTAMEQVFFGIQPIAGARTPGGFAAQLLAGLAAGYVFAVLTSASSRARA